MAKSVGHKIFLVPAPSRGVAFAALGFNVSDINWVLPLLLSSTARRLFGLQVNDTTAK